MDQQTSDYVCDQVKAAAERLEEGIQGVSFHRFEVTTIGLKLTLGRLTADDQICQLTRIAPWNELEQIRSLGVPTFLSQFLDATVEELLKNDLTDMREALFSS